MCGGWLASYQSHWGLGYATEAAQSAIAFGFTHLALKQIVAFTSLSNLRSRAVMDRLGMRFAYEFDHPQISLESGLRRHVLYGIQHTDRDTDLSVKD